MSVKKINDININELQSLYNLDDLQVIEDNKIISVWIKTNSSNLQVHWKTINSVLSELLDKYLDNSFTKWNVYILYLATDIISKELKYKIENNTFFARKIIEDKYSLELSDENIEKLISEHIEFTDLTIKATQPKKEVYQSKSEVYTSLGKVDKLSESKIDEILKSLEKDDNEI